MTRRSLLLLPLLLALVGSLTLPVLAVRAQEGGIPCTTTVAQSLINTGQSVFYSAEPRSTESGSVIFFWSTGDLEGNGQNADGNIEIFRSELHFNLDGSVTRTFKQITRSTGSILGGFNLAPDISADGRHLAFFSDRHYPGSGFDNTDGNFEIFVADLSNLNSVSLRQITNTTQGSNLYPTISDDGRWLAFISDNGLDPKTAGAVPDAERNLDVYLVDLAANPVVFEQITQTPLGVFNGAPNLSGDGSTLVFASTQNIGNPEGNQEIFRYTIGSRLLAALTTTPGGTNETPVISKDGSRVAFVSDQRLDSTVNIVGIRQLFLSPNPATGLGFLQISDTPGADNFGPNISADGNRVVYQRQESATGQRVVLYDVVAQSRQIFRSRTNPTTGELGAPILSGNGTVLFYEDEGGISAIECSISDLGLVASVSPGTVVAGESQTFVWTVSNQDKADASGVQVQATLPADFALRSILPTASCSATGQTVGCTFSRLGAGESRTMTATVAVSNRTTGSQNTTIRAFSDTSVDRNPSNNAQTLTSQVLTQADLGLVKSAFPDTALQNEAITYTLVVSSTGPSLARSVRITDTLPGGLVFVASPACTAAGSGVSCALGDMLPGATLSVTVRTRVSAVQEADVVNQAIVASDSTADPAPLNNRVVITNSVNTQFDLSVTHSVAPRPLLAGAPLVYTYLITNAGPSLADTVQLSATLPAELVTFSPLQIAGPGSCTTGNPFTCDLGTVGRNQTVAVTVSGLLSPTLSGPLTSLALVRSLTEANADKTTANDSHVLVATVEQKADLAASKSLSPSVVVAGSLLTFTLGVQNLGPSVATAVTISDTLPAGMILTALATSQGSCSGSTLVSCLIGSLLPGANGSVTATVRASASALGVLTNTVNVRSVVADPNPLNDNASIPVLVQDEASVTLVKAVSQAAVTAGQDTFFYTLGVGNAGPSVARSVLLTDTLPAGVTYIGSTPPAGASCSHASGVVTCTLGIIGAGITQTVRIDVAAASAASGLLVNTATVSTSASDPNGANTATATTTANQFADLQVTKRATIANLNVSGTVTYTVNVDNFGPSNATGVVITDLLPIGLLSPAVVVNQGSYNQASSLWTVGNVAAGQKMTMTVAGSLGSAMSGLVITNTAQVQSANQSDPVLVNNGQFVTFTVPLNADVAVAQSSSALTPSVLSLVTLVLTATNNGPATATNAQVSDLLPSQLSFASQSASSGVYSPTTGIWQVGSLVQSGQAVLTLTARVIGSGSFANTATVTAAEYDDKLSNNRADVSLTVGPAADLRLVQTVSSAAPNVGDTLFFTVTLTNDGPDLASAIQVRSLLSTGVDTIFVTPASGTTYSTTTRLWDIPNLAASANLTLVISKTVSVSGVQTSTAEILASSRFDPDSTPGNGLGRGEDDEASVSLTLPPAADLGLSLSASGGQFVGQDALFVLQIVNNGPDPATNIVLTETLPTHLSYLIHLVDGSGLYDPTSQRWTIPSLAVGAFSILNVTAKVGPGAAGQIVSDTIEGMIADQYDWKLVNNTPSVTFLVGGADLAVAKRVDRSVADVGSQVRYTIVVTNSGPTATTNVRVTDTLPISLTNIISATTVGAFGPNTPGSPGLWTIPSLAVGASETLILTGTVIPGSANQLITNTISGVSSAVADGNPANNTTAVSFRASAADLVLQKTSTVTQPVEGQAFNYFLSVSNSGPDVATRVVVTDTLTQGITVTVAGAGYNLTTGRWDVGTLAVGEIKSLLLTVLPIVGVSGGQVIVDPIDAVKSDQEDPNPAINASVTITVAGADLQLSKTASNTAPDAGTTIGFSLNLSNTGPLDAGQVVVTDTLPAGLALIGTPTFSAGSLAVDAPNGLITWTHTSLVVGATAQLQMNTTVAANSGGQILVNRAGLASVQASGGGGLPDPNKPNHTPSVTILPQTGDLFLTITGSPNPVNAGAPLLYTTIITNSGPTPVANFILTNTLPASVNVQSTSPGCTVTFPTVVCVQNSSLGVNASRSYTIVVTSAALTALVHTATVSTTTPETSLGNNNATQTSTVDPGSPVRFVIGGLGSQSVGITQTLTITARDTFGNVAGGYNGDKSLTFSGASLAPSGANPTVTDKNGVARAFGVATTINFVNGVATVSGGNNGVLALVKVETATISVTDGLVVASGADRLTVAVSAGPAAQLVVTGSASQTAGSGQNLTIAALDSVGNPAPSYNGDKVLTFSGASNGPNGSQPSVVNKDGVSRTFGLTTTISFASGVATVSAGSNGLLVLVKTETATVAVSDGAIGSAGSNNLAVTVSGGAVHNLIFSTQPSVSGTSAFNLAQQPAVQLRDQFNNPTSATDSIGLAAFSDVSCTAAAGGLFNGGGPIAAVNGLATFSGVNYNLAQTIYLKATDTTSGAVLTACSSGILIGHGAASQLFITVQPGSASTGNALNPAPQIQARDSHGNVVTSDSSSSINAAILSGSGTFVNSTTQVQLVAGLAILSNLRFTVADTYRLRFSINTAAFTVDSASFTVSGGTPAKLRISGSTTQVAGTSQNLTISALDAASNVATAYTGTKSLTFNLDSGVGLGLDGSQPTITDLTGTPQPIGFSTNITFADGMATVSGGANGALRLVRTGTVVLAATDGGGLFAAGSDRLTVNVSPGPAHNLTFTQQPGNTATAGVNFSPQPTVQIRDQFNNPTTDTNTIVLTVFTDASCTTAGTGTLNGGSGTGAISGVATFSGVNYTKAETIRLKASSGVLTTACSSAVTVSPAAAAKLVITGSASQTAGVAQNLTITAQDSFGNTATGYTGDRSLTFSGAANAPNGAIPTVTNKNGTATNFGVVTTITFASGVATASGGNNGALTLKKAEIATVNVSEGIINSTSGGSLAVTVSGAGPHNLIFATQPSSGATAGANFTQQPALQIRDQFNNPTTSADTIVLTVFTDASCSSAATGTLNGGAGTPATSGTATFSGVNYQKAETVYLKAADSTTGGVTTACSNSIVVGPATVAKLVISGSASQTAGTSQNLTIAAQDAFGNSVSTYSGSKNLTFSGANPAPNGSNPTVTDSSGNVIAFGTATPINFSSGFAFVSGSNNGAMRLYKAESATVGVTDGSISSSGAGSLAVTVSPAGPNNLIFSTQPSNTATAGTNFGQQPVAQIRDQFNNTTSTDTIVLTAFTDASCTVTAGGVLTGGSGTAAVSGTATFSGVAYTKAETIRLKATDSTTGGVTTACSSAVAVNAGAFTKLQILVPGETAAPGTATGKTGTPSAQTAGTQFAVTVNAVDANWNVVSSTDTVGITSSDANATLPSNAALAAGTASFNVTLKTAGSKTVTATDITDGTKTASTSPSVTVNAGTFTKLQILLPGETAAPGTATGKTGTPSAQTAGTAFAVTVRAVDANWNLVNTVTDIVGITSSDVNATLPANAALVAGTQNFNVTLKTAGTATVTATDITDGTKTANTSPSVTVNAGLPNNLFFIQEPSGSVSAGVAFTTQPIVQIRDQYNNVTGSADLVTLTPFTENTCTTATGGTLANASLNALSGVATFSTVSHSVAGTIYLKATISPGGGSITQCSSSSVTVSSSLLAFSADMGLHANAESFTSAVGQTAQFIVTATNSGPGIVTNARLRWTIPSELPISTVQAGQNVCTTVKGGWLCDLGELSAGAEVSLTLAFTSTVAGEYKLAAAIEGDRLDPNLDNDRVTIAVVVSSAEPFRRIFLPLLQSQMDAERNRPEEEEIYLPSVSNP